MRVDCYTWYGEKKTGIRVREEGRSLNRPVFPAVLATRATPNSCHPVADRILLHHRTENRLKRVPAIFKSTHPFASPTTDMRMSHVDVRDKSRTHSSFAENREHGIIGTEDSLTSVVRRAFHEHFLSLITT